MAANDRGKWEKFRKKWHAIESKQINICFASVTVGGWELLRNKTLGGFGIVLLVFNYFISLYFLLDLCLCIVYVFY